MRLPARHLLTIDRWFYPLNRLVRGLRGSSVREAQKGRVAVVKLMGLGSIIRLLSLCRERQVDFSRVVLVTFDSNREACHLLGIEHGLFIRTRNIFHFVLDCLKAVFTMKQTKPDWIIDFERCSNAVSVFRQFLALAGGSRTLAFDDLDPVENPRHTLLNINQYSFHEMLLKGIERMPKADQHTVSEVRGLRNSTKVIININCSDYLLARRYPRHLFREVIEALGRRDESEFYLTGSASERGYVEELAEGLTSSGVRVHNVAGEWSLTQLQQEVITSGLFISCDSGPLHLAIHLGVPTLAIWGPTRPQHFGYRDSEVLVNVSEKLPCAPCFMHPHSVPAVSCEGRISCLHDLSPGAIIRPAEKLLERSKETSLLPAASW